MASTDPTPSLEQGRWKLDPSDAEVRFTTRTFWGAVPVHGRFHRYEGTFELSADPAIELIVDADSLDTQNAKRDTHLRSADFFDVEHHPEVRFVSSDVHVHGDHLHVSGTLHAVGRSIVVEPSAHVHPVEGGFVIDAVVRVDHRQLGMTANPAGMIRAKSWLSVRGRLVPA